MADLQITPSELDEWNVAATECVGEVGYSHRRMHVLSLLTRDVHDVRNFEDASSRSGIRNGLRLLDPPTSNEAA